jgi:hypothetical protein
MHTDYPKNPPGLDWSSCWIGTAVWTAIVQQERAHRARRRPSLTLSRSRLRASRGLHDYILFA